MTANSTDSSGQYDAVIIGAGINGMVAAAELAGHGWRVCLVDGRDRIGGFIDGGELTVPGYRHDTFSSWHPLFVTSGAYAELGPHLARHGLEYCNTEDAHPQGGNTPDGADLLCASVAADGTVSVAYRDPARTAAGFADPRDGAAYLAMLARVGSELGTLGALLSTELRGRAALKLTRPLLGTARRQRRAGLEQWMRDGVSSGRALLRRQFHGPEADHLWAPWLLHAGLAPDDASGGLMAPLFAGTLHGAGLPVVRGGADRFVQAFTGLLAERGVDVRCGQAVSQIEVTGGRATGVRVGGDLIGARRAVLASVTPGALYGQLLPAGVAPEPVTREAGEYRFGRAAMQVHVALTAPVPWTDSRLAASPLVHVSDGSSSTAIACAQAEAGLLPQAPTVVVGQQYLLDPSRVPAGAASLWLQLQELPFRPRGDAAGVLDTSHGWTPELAQGYLERVLDRIEAHAPGLRGLIAGTQVITPADLAATNPNAVDGDPYSGAAQLDQNLFWRPGPLAARHRTPVDALWHIGASTHPGPGLGAGSGHLVAQQLITSTERRFRQRRGVHS